MSESSRKETIMDLASDQISELRLIIHPYPRHTTVALVTRLRDGRENFDRRIHAWDLRLPQGDYEKYSAEDQLWMILGALAASTKPRRAVGWAQPAGSPEGDRRGEQLPLPYPWDRLDRSATLESTGKPSERSAAEPLR